MSKITKEYVLNQLQIMNGKDDDARVFFEWLASLDGHKRVCKVITAVKGVAQYTDSLGRREVPQAKIVRIMRELDELKFGKFIVGRRGGKTRFEFRIHRVHIGQCALGISNDFEVMEEPNEAYPDDDDVIEAYRILLAKELGKPMNAIEIVVRDH